jgi:hypothetical protein
MSCAGNSPGGSYWGGMKGEREREGKKEREKEGKKRMEEGGEKAGRQEGRKFRNEKFGRSVCKKTNE